MGDWMRASPYYQRIMGLMLIYRTISAGGSFGGSPFQQTIAFSFDELLQIDIYGHRALSNPSISC